MHRQTLANSPASAPLGPSPALAPALAPPLPPRPRLPPINSIQSIPSINSIHTHSPNPISGFSSVDSRPSNAPLPLTLQRPLPLPPSPSPPNYSQSMHSHHQFPSPSDNDRLPPLVHHDGDSRTLPSLSSITGDVAMRADDQHRPPQHLHSLPNPPPPLHQNQNHWPSSFNGSLNSYRQPPPFHAPDSPATIMDMDGAASVASAASPSPDRIYDGTPTPSSLTLDDPDVRLAAEALGDLRADFVSSPPADSSSLPPMSPPIAPFQLQQTKPKSPKPEPLLSLLTTAHPLVASTIGGASSAYGGAKNFSPRFKSGAEYVEGYLTPIANTVNSVGRVTGVEGGVRWFLGAGRRHPAPTSDPDSNGSNKRRRTGESSSTSSDANGSPDNGLDDSSSVMSKTPRRLSTASTVDTLPAYDDQRSPAYSETAPATHKPPGSQPWQTRLMMSTSGLSVAMSAESLRSLKYCLRWLRWTNDHMNRAILNLKHALEEYEKAERKERSEGGPSTESSSDAEAMDVDGAEKSQDKPNPSRSELAARINSLKGDILKSLQDVINNVSKYAGGALPENARVLVRRHLTSLPQRFRLATMSDGRSGNSNGDNDSAMREGAQKVLVLAKEGLDMVTQVTGVLDGTIVSAEQWCERMGKRRNPDGEEREEAASSSQQIEFGSDEKSG
ncbi:transcription factor opi1 domain-containing protein [Trichoderma breve]|uniref:Transcription factor opi1 domain-containing protein n=1 Tax=Trichoderma breve TaxID=2034170 RepID=A0A9W9JQP5_9HYPO|nr:transcription factor opi1 domain-containing protein [Trichoderma breve]KAJ4864031.1 transcription factor opi1 domain-containing protein [Trichoderma breve]